MAPAKPSAPLSSDLKPTVRVYTRTQKVVVLLAGILLSAISYGSDLASGILYAKLLESRSCAAANTMNSSITDNATSPQTWSQTRLTVADSISVQTTVLTREDEGSGCDELGENATAAKSPSCTTVNTTTSSVTDVDNTTAPETWSQTAVKVANVSAQAAKFKLARKGNSSGCGGGFGESATATVWVVSIYTAVRCSMAPLGGILLDTFGNRGAAKIGAVFFMVGVTTSTFATELYHLYFTTVISGIGGGIGCVLCFKTMNSVFPKKKDVMSGIVGFGTGTAAIVYAIAGTYAMERAGWRGYYYLLDAVIIVTFIVILFLPRDIHVIKTMAETSAAESSKCGYITARLRFSAYEFARGFRRAFALYQDAGFHLANAGSFFYGLGVFFPLVFAVKRAKEFGADQSKANDQIAAVGAALAIGSFGGCVAFNRLRLRPLISQGVSLVVLGGASIVMLLMTNYNELLISMIIFSLVLGPADFLLPASCEQAIKKKKLVAHCHGHVLLFASVSVLTGPPLAAWLYDTSNTYTAPYLTGGIFLTIGGIFMCVADWRHQRNLKSKFSDKTGEKQLVISNKTATME